MIKRTIVLTSNCRVSIKDRQLVVENLDSGEIRTAPVEDVGIVLIENQKVSISVPALNALVSNNCAVVYCDSKHMPSSMLLSLDSNSVQGERFRQQAEASAPLKKNLWKQIVQRKIKNQARLLTEIGQDGNALKPLYSNVKSGDSDNREGLASRKYWDMLLGSDFIRSRFGEAPNPLLNYGYTILRAGMARAIMGSGLLPTFGLFHKNRYNAFPLADDLMEPYRPYVDQIVYQICIDGETELKTNTKQRLLRVMYIDTKVNGITRPLEIALTLTSASLARCFSGEEKELSLPLL